MQFIISGGKELEGEITAAGSKNAATPIIAATLLTDRPCVIRNVPRIGDVHTMLEILVSMGSSQEWRDQHTIVITNKDIDPAKLDQKLVGKIRSSVLLIGPLLARFGSAELAMPGGCHIGSRSIDTHLEAFIRAGARASFDERAGRYRIELREQGERRVPLREFSVTATENLMMFGVRVPITIALAALEPHVACLGRFLQQLGADVRGLGTHTISIQPPASPLTAIIEHEIITDDIEIGTVGVLAAATKSTLVIRGVVSERIEAVLEKLREMGVVFSIAGDSLEVHGSSADLRAAKIEARPYPGLPTDLQAPFGVLATQARGASLVFDTLYDGRLQYTDALAKMGADVSVLDPHRALITGPTVLHGTTMESLDLRAGATLVIASLIAKGKSVIEGVDQIDRGYEALDERLRSIGADITRVS